MDLDDDIVKVKIEAYWLNDKDFFKTFKHLLDIGDQTIEFLPRKFFNVVKDILKPELILLMNWKSNRVG